MGRNVRAPALYPVRLFATLYIDIVRGVPVILWITLIGFGVPALLQTREWYGKFIIWGSVALVMTYSAYVAEVFRSGIEGVHESQRAAARSLGLSTGQTMRSVVLPQAVRRVVPPLMNDFVSLQKDVALISVLGPVEAMRRASIEVARTFNFTPYVAAAVLFLCVSIPLTRLTDHLLQRERREMIGNGRHVKLALEGVVKEFGDLRVLDGIDLAVDTSEVVALIGASGSGKSTLLRCINLLEPIDDGRILLDGDDISEPGPQPGPDTAAHRDGLPELQPVPPPDGGGEHRAGAAQAAADATRRRPDAQALELLSPSRSRRQGRHLPGPPVGRAAAARRHRPVAGHGPGGDAARRGDVGARSRARRRGARRRPRPAVRRA